MADQPDIKRHPSQRFQRPFWEHRRDGLSLHLQADAVGDFD
jgi:hypothetical protein